MSIDCTGCPDCLDAGPDIDSTPAELLREIRDQLRTPLHPQLHELAEIVAPSRNVTVEPAPRIVTGTTVGRSGEIMQLVAASPDRLRVDVIGYAPLGSDPDTGGVGGIHTGPDGLPIDTGSPDGTPAGAALVPIRSVLAPATVITLATTAGVWVSSPLDGVLWSWIAYYR